MFGKLGILISILVLVLLFYFVISLGAGAFSKGKIKPETKRYLKSVNILLIIIAIIGYFSFIFIICLSNQRFTPSNYSIIINKHYCKKNYPNNK